MITGLADACVGTAAATPITAAPATAVVKILFMVVLLSERRYGALPAGDRFAHASKHDP
jgi:hypothetical protein